MADGRAAQRFRPAPDMYELTELVAILAIVTCGPGRPDLPLTYDTVREQILKFIDFANIEMYFASIAHWLGELPAADRDRILRELDDIAAGSDPRRQDDTSYLLNDLGLRRVRWTDEPGGANTT